MALHRSLKQAAGTVAACVALIPVAAACGGSNGQGAGKATPGGGSTGGPIRPATRVAGGRTLLQLDPTLQRALALTGVKISPVAPATTAGKAIVLPITGGRLERGAPVGRIEHGGGLRFSVAGHELRATHLILRPKLGRVTAIVGGRRVPLLETTLGQVRNAPGSGSVLLPSQAKFGKGAAKLLHDALGVQALSGGLTLGRLSADVKRG
jgi:hypothetical protein